jgi:MoaA/NifB/PqqE/SkfB family radical SAM enzyme
MLPAESVRDGVDSECCFRPIRGGGVRVTWKITSACNLDCAHCFVPRGPLGLTTDEALRVIADFPLLGVRKVMLTGGEPLVRKDALKLIDACLAVDALVDLNTNLTLAGPATVAALCDLGLQEVTTSLDGPDEIHDAIRRAPGNFKLVTAAISRLVAVGIKVDVVCVAQRANAAAIGETIRIVRSLGASSMTVSGFNHQGAAKEKGHLVELLPGQLEQVRDQVFAARKRAGADFPIRTVGLLRRFEGPVPCPISDLIAIDADGTVSGCLLAPVPATGRRDVRAGLLPAVAAIDRRFCCSTDGWCPSLAAAGEEA